MITLSNGNNGSDLCVILGGIIVQASNVLRNGLSKIRCSFDPSSTRDASLIVNNQVRGNRVAKAVYSIDHPRILVENVSDVLVLVFVAIIILKASVVTVTKIFYK